MLLAVAEAGVAVGVPAQIERAVRIEGCRGRRRASLGRAVRFARAQASSCSGDGDEARRAEMRKSLSRSWRTNAQGGAGAPGLTYKDAGVDIDAGAELVRRIAAMTPGIGGFGGLFPFGDSYLVAGTDGVGTKLKLAFDLDIHDTIGIDLVAMSVNDIITSGAKPMFFLDYFATSRLDVDQAEQVIKGIVEGCKQSDCALLGGETAEMPDFYAEGEYDLSGFAVGSVKKDALIDGKNIKVGDQIIGLASSGVHSNGFSLVRRVLARSGATLFDALPGAEATTIGEALLAPTVIYVKQVLDIISKGGVKGIAHITGGGFTDNIPRVFPSGLGAHVKVGVWDVPPIFKWLQKAGGVEEAEMFRTFNMGIGMILVVSPQVAEEIVLTNSNACLLGHVVEGDGVTYGK
ncbi:phosphoribosylformylglycinamidine cyclo-ligase [Marchantia polymorpha subsp. ruderalis]|uniref:phosphoribosylformylglycinamidine cyclo-ligase n=2 Tax=Marchantia polymorpha TaxID=3197 RepID=A0A176WNI2_MARPO|nr:hypothetical protein AXG93_4875s1340 [Marchantia polymorpha subsp. ruderalis]PTQ49426.1 hypothetical protein MARPO_0003s0273 [Marchantia polymorpha]BBN17191.1 hypothetical protein Mp_7g12650 [Marchantia polymorpha subsp. ruderalis]|eukprot:PTQ49426.1 hypothetical protein MARPO_0003s0273 [Marchantia polymorpha]